MNNKKKIILFLGAISLIAFGNYTRFLKNNNGKTVVEGKNSEKATSSAGGKTGTEGKNAEQTTSLGGNNKIQNAQNTEVMAEIKSVPQSELQPAPAVQTQNKPVNNDSQSKVSEKKNTKNDNNQKKKENSPKIGIGIILGVFYHLSNEK